MDANGENTPSGKTKKINISIIMFSCIIILNMGLTIGKCHGILARKKIKEGIIMEATLDKFGRIVIPKKIREDYNLRPGSPIRIEEGKGEILLKPIEGEPTLIEKDGVLVFTGIPLEEIANHIDAARQQRSRLLRGF
jgi:AbrB family looped-hinge helix DNA binding protein